MRLYLFIAIILFINVPSNSQSGIQNLGIINNNDISYEDALVKVSFDKVKAKLPGLQRNNFVIKDSAGNNIPFQMIVNQSGEEEIAFVTDFKAAEIKDLFIHYRRAMKVPQFENRTYAELSMKPVNKYDGKKFRGDRFYNVYSIKVPKQHTDHDALFKYEGPGWESEKVGYRFYLDWRNTNDIFGKKVNKLILAETGVTDTVASDDSYHNMQDWGMDIFKVGNSLGIGSIGMIFKDSVYSVSVTDSIYFNLVTNGPVISEIETKYFGWAIGDKKYNLISNLSIAAGSRMTNCNLIIPGAENITTGLAKYEGTEFIKKENKDGWSYIALYGNQTLVSNEDKLGIAVLYKSRDLIRGGEDNLNHFVELKPERGKLQYFFCAAWEQEPDGIKTKEEFIKYLNEQSAYLNNPPQVLLEKAGVR